VERIGLADEEDGVTALPKMSRKTRTAVGLLFLGLLGSFALAFSVSQSQYAEPTLEIVAYYAEDSTAEIFSSDEYGNFSPTRSESMSAVIGINRLELDLRGSFGDRSFAYRFDPCTCSAPVVIAGVSLVSPFATVDIPAEAWQPGGSSSLVPEGTYFLLKDTSAAADPQLILYPDVSDRQGDFRAQAFWVVFLAALATVLSILVAGFLLLRRRQQVTRVDTLDDFTWPRWSGVKPPWWLISASLLLFSAGSIQQFWGAIRSGVTIDEPLHVEHLTRFFESGVYSSSAYGPATALFGHALNVLVGYEEWGTLSMTAEAYAVRHIAVAILGLLSAFSVAVITRVVLGNWRWALVAAGLLSSLPVWVGHSMFNIKDVPLAAGLTMFTAGVVLVESKVFRRVFRLALGVLLIFLGVIFGVGTRPIGVALILVSVVVLGFVSAAPKIFAFLRTISLARIMGGAVVGVVGLAILFLAFLEMGAGFILTNLQYPWDHWNLYGGNRVQSRPGLWNVLVVYAATMPILVGLLIVVGIVALGRKFIGVHYSAKDGFSRRGAYALIATQALGAFFAVLLFNPVLYDSARQILFVLPALAIIATFGLYAVLETVRGMQNHRKATEALVGLTVAVGLITPMVSQAQLFPYNYSFYNVIAQGTGVNGSWETDYWGSSVREAARVVAPGDPATCTSVGDLNLNIGSLEPCATLAPYVGDSAVADQSQLQESHFWVIRGERALAEFGPIASDNCNFHSQVTRPLRGEDVSMTWVYQCEDR
jgi:hypothetical protein